MHHQESLGTGSQSPVGNLYHQITSITQKKYISSLVGNVVDVGPHCTTRTLVSIDDSAVNLTPHRTPWSAGPRELTACQLRWEDTLMGGALTAQDGEASEARALCASLFFRFWLWVEQDQRLQAPASLTSPL